MLQLNDAAFDSDHSTRGRFIWAWVLLTPHSNFCASPSPTLLWSLLVVLPTSLSLGITEIVFRNQLADDDSGRYGGKVHWTLDIAYVVWIIYLLFVILRCIFAVIHIRLEDDKLRDPLRKQPVFAILARVAYSIAIPSTIVLFIVYIALATTGHRLHPHTSAFFAVNFVFAIIDIVFFEIHILGEHAIASLALAYIWVFPLSIIHFLLANTQDKKPYIYGVADWGHPLQSILYITAISLLTSLVYAAIAAYCDWKHSGVGKNAFVLLDDNNDNATLDNNPLGG